MSTRCYTTEYSGKRVLILGGLGFIGSTLALQLLELGAKVTIVDSLIPQYGGNLFNIEGIESKVTVNISDVRDEHSLKYLLQDQEILFNLAGQTSHMDSMADPFTDMEINCRAQLSILETCRKVNPVVRIVFASTRQIYGRPDYLPVDEKHLLRPVDVNGVNKMAGECYHILYNNVYGIRSCSLRLTNTYGPRMRVKDARQTFLGVWIKALLHNEPIEVWGGQQLRDFSYVEDVVDAMLIAAVHDSASGRVFNVGGDCVISLLELAHLMMRLNGGGEVVVREFPAERKKIDIGDYYSCDAALRESLGWAPRVSLEEGLKRTLDYYRIHLEHYL